MPNCFRCKRPVIFCRLVQGDGTLSPKAVPIDVDPNNDRGTTVLMKYPLGYGPNCPWPANAPAQEVVARKIYGEAAATSVRLGGALYTIHFDTCRNR